MSFRWVWPRLIIIFNYLDNSNCSLCHFDGSDLEGGVNSMILSLKNVNAQHTASNVNNSYSLYIVGGFDDDKNSSLELTLGLFG